MPVADQHEFGCDPSIVDWTHYVTGIHLPSVVEHARVKTEGVRSDPDARTKRLKKRVLSPDRQVAAFDLENTIIASNVVFSYAYLATRRMPPAERLRFMAKTVAEGPSLLALDQIVNTAATLLHMSGGQFEVPLVIRMTTGAGRQLAAQHSHSLEGWYAHVPGLRVVAPATPADASPLWPKETM